MKGRRKQLDNELIVSEYYDEWAEELRMTRDRGRNIEFLTTMNYIKRYLKAGDKILELGCGTGVYSLNLAKEGYDITAVDISQKNLDILKSKITDGMSIEVNKMNATDLSCIPDNFYNVTLALGPLYHLFDKEDIDKVITEAKRVTKKEGFIFIAFLTKDYITIRNCQEIFDVSVRHLNNKYKFVNSLEEIFYYFYIDEFEQLMKKHELSKLHLLTTDGISRFINAEINNLSDNGYDKYLHYIINNCERRELMGFSPHLLYITRNV